MTTFYKLNIFNYTIDIIRILDMQENTNVMYYVTNLSAFY